MIGIVVVTHGRLADEMVRTLQGVMGPVVQIGAVSTAGTDDLDTLRHEILVAAGEADSGEGILILTDMLGDTATNLSLAIASEMNCEVVAGVNMPMLVKAVTSRVGVSLGELASLIPEYGRSHIHWASHGRDPRRARP